jgi:hypothetical protein
MRADTVAIAMALFGGLFLLCEGSVVLNAAGVALLVAIGAYEWRMHSGPTKPTQRAAPRDELPPSKREVD